MASILIRNFWAHISISNMWTSNKRISDYKFFFIFVTYSYNNKSLLHDACISINHLKIANRCCWQPSATLRLTKHSNSSTFTNQQHNVWPIRSNFSLIGIIIGLTHQFKSDQFGWFEYDCLFPNASVFNDVRCDNFEFLGHAEYSIYYRTKYSTFIKVKVFY